MRPATLALSLLLTTGLLSACGKSGASVTHTVTVAGQPPSGRSAPPSGNSPPSGSSPSHPGGSSTNPSSEAQLARQRALAFARAVNLRSADVPGYRPSSSEEHQSSATEQRLNTEMQRCVGASGSGHPLAEASSREFQRGASIAQQSVSSNITVARTAAIAREELQKFQSAHTRSCFAHYFQGLFRSSHFRGATVGPVSIAHGTPPAPGTSGAFGWRVSTAIVIRAVRIPFYLDILGFVYGPAEVTLLSSGLPVPIPAATEQRLFLLLLSRAKAQHL